MLSGSKVNQFAGSGCAPRGGPRRCDTGNRKPPRQGSSSRHGGGFRSWAGSSASARPPATMQCARVPRERSRRAMCRLRHRVGHSSGSNPGNGRTQRRQRRCFGPAARRRSAAWCQCRRVGVGCLPRGQRRPLPPPIVRGRPARMPRVDGAGVLGPTGGCGNKRPPARSRLRGQQFTRGAGVRICRRHCSASPQRKPRLKRRSMAFPGRRDDSS